MNLAPIRRYTRTPLVLRVQQYLPARAVEGRASQMDCVPSPARLPLSGVVSSPGIDPCRSPDGATPLQRVPANNEPTAMPVPATVGSLTKGA